MAYEDSSELKQVDVRRDSSVPLYRQIKNDLSLEIQSGSLSPGDLVPGDLELMERYGVSRTTARQALKELEIAGLVSRHRGRGTFVTQPKLRHGPGGGHHLSDSLRLIPGVGLLRCVIPVSISSAKRYHRLTSRVYRELDSP